MSSLKNCRASVGSMLYDILSNKSLTYMDSKGQVQVDPSQYKTLQGIRVRKLENQSKMEKILMKIR